MDVYHKVLVKLYEVTGGKESETVDLKELVKKEGFLPSYVDIFQHLSRQSWISETPRPDSVRITHWGVSEAKKSQAPAGDSRQNAKREVNRLLSESRELTKLLEELASDTSRETFGRVEKKLAEINSAISKLRESVQ